jgi:predicted AAA+ superfamily ATPase
VHNQAELDLLLFVKGRRLGYEVKYTDAPKVTSSQKQALEHLGLESLTVVIPGAADYPLAEKIRALGLRRMMAVD